MDDRALSRPREARRVIRLDRGVLVTVGIMATRVPKSGPPRSGTRPQGKTASRTPPAGPPRSRYGSSRRRYSGKGKPAKGRGKGGRPQKKQPTSPFVILLEWIGQAIAAV